MTGPIDEVIRQARRQLIRGMMLASVFGLFINLLQLVNPIYMIQVYDRVLSSRSTDTLLLLAIIACAALVVHGILDYIRSRIFHIVGESIARRFNLITLEAALRETLDGDPGRAAQASRDLSELRSFLVGTSIGLPLEAMWVPLLLLVLYMMHPVFGALALLSAGLLVGFSVANDLISRPRIAEASSAATANFADVASAVRQAEAIEAMGMLPAIARRWDIAQLRVLRLLDEGSRVAKLISSLSRTSRMAMQILILSVGAILVIDREVSPGAIFAASIILGRVLMPFEQLIEGWRQWVLALAAWGRVRELLKRGGSRRSSMAFPRPEGRLTVDRAVFVPTGTDRAVLKGVSFGLEPGEVLGIVGPSAAGKSTLARLLVGLYEPSAGGVFLDGHSVFHWERENFGRYVGYLPQTIQLLNGTVRENIARMGEADPRDVLAAARQADVHDMIGRLPYGYETRIADGGASLSGGQRQRIGLARALFGNPRLLVLDEPNANLDADGEQALLRAIALAKQGGTTVVLIAHRPSLMAAADKLLVMREGRVDQFGPQAEVMRAITSKAVAAVPAVPGVARISRLVQPGERR